MFDPGSMIELHRAIPADVRIDQPGLTLVQELGLGIAKVQIFGGSRDPNLRRTALPVVPLPHEQMQEDSLNIAWLAPDEWLLTGPEREIIAWLAWIEERTSDQVLAVDLTHARVSFLISGTAARDALASHCPLDLWVGAFPVNAVARSLLGDTGMFIARLADLPEGPQFRFIVDQTMANYAARMLAGH